jgi:hypothetical protein
MLLNAHETATTTMRGNESNATEIRHTQANITESMNPSNGNDGLWTGVGSRLGNDEMHPTFSVLSSHFSMTSSQNEAPHPFSFPARYAAPHPTLSLNPYPPPSHPTEGTRQPGNLHAQRVAAYTQACQSTHSTLPHDAHAPPHDVYTLPHAVHPLPHTSKYNTTMHAHALPTQPATRIQELTARHIHAMPHVAHTLPHAEHLKPYNMHEPALPYNMQEHALPRKLPKHAVPHNLQDHASLHELQEQASPYTLHKHATPCNSHTQHAYLQTAST